MEPICFGIVELKLLCDKSNNLNFDSWVIESEIVPVNLLWAKFNINNLVRLKILCGIDPVKLWWQFIL